MATPWQYNYPGESKPVVTTDAGYAVNFPDQPSRLYRADANRYTAYLECEIDGGIQRRHIYVHNIEFNFEVAGSYAQSPTFRAWYPRNFVQPRIAISGQTASQADYGSLVEFIRKTQRKATITSNNPDDPDPLQTVRLHIPGANRNTHPVVQYMGHSMSGFIPAVQRVSERWVNAPEFQFEFVVVTASAGIFQTSTADASGMTKEISKYMRPDVATQVRNQIRSGTTVEWAPDPDDGPGGNLSGKGARSYDKGVNPG